MLLRVMMKLVFDVNDNRNLSILYPALLLYSRISSRPLENTSIIYCCDGIRWWHCFIWTKFMIILPAALFFFTRQMELMKVKFCFELNHLYFQSKFVAPSKICCKIGANQISILLFQFPQPTHFSLIIRS